MHAIDIDDTCSLFCCSDEEYATGEDAPLSVVLTHTIL